MALDALGGTDYQPYDYMAAMKRRLQNIEGIGEGMTQRLQAQQQIKSANARAAEMEKLSSMRPTGQYQDFSNYGGAMGGAGSKNVPATVGSFINAIAGQESGGNYGAVNRMSGALGKYQIMPSNIAGWSREALGRSISPQQFLANPQLQDKIAHHMLQKYYTQYGPQGAAVAWYAGPGAVAGYMKHPGGYEKGQAGGHPSIANYVRSVMGRMR
jgi:hypothetical protein